MAAELATAYVNLVPSMSGFTAKLKAGMTPAANEAGDAAGVTSGTSYSNSFGSTIKRMIGPAMAMIGIAALTRFASSSVDSFAKLEDATGAASVIFGDSMSTIIAQSKTAAGTIGMSSAQVIDAANTFGTYGKSAGLAGDDLALFSTDMTSLAGDMASFKGTTPEEAIQAIGAALRGEAEPIRRYGVLLDDATLKARAMEMGIYDGTSALTPQQKALAAQAEILAQTGDAQGDFARTMESTANVGKTTAAKYANMQAVIGGALAPAFTAVRTAASGVFDNISAAIPGIVAGFQNLSKWVKDNATWLGALAAAVTAGAVGWGVYMLVTQGIPAVLTAVKLAVKAVNTAMRDNPIGIVITLIMALVAGFIYLWNNCEGFRNFWLGLWAGIQTAVAAVVGWFTGTVGPAFASAWESIKSGAASVGAFFAGVWAAILAAVAAVVGWFTGTLVPALSGAWTAIQAGVAVLGAVLSAGWNTIKSTAEGIWNAIVSFVTGIPARFTAGLAALAEIPARIGEWITAAKAKVEEIFNAIVAWVAGVPSRFMSNLAALSELAGKVGAWVLAAKEAAVAKFNELVTWVGGIPGRVASALGDLGQLAAKVGAWFASAKEAAVEKFNSLVDWVKGIPGRITGALGNLGNILYNAGAQIISGFLNGLKAKWGDVTSWVGGIGTWIAEHKGPKSYDLGLLRPAGGWIMQGLQVGLEDEIPALGRTMGRVTGAIAVGGASMGTYGARPAAVSSGADIAAHLRGVFRADLQGAEIVLTGMNPLANSVAARLNLALAQGA